MTGVLEVAAAASAIAAFARSRHEKERTEEKVAADLYARFFHADLLDVSPDRASTTSSERFQNLDANAAAAVRAIERYQKERKRWFLWMSSSSEQTGDTRTRVLEEMKLWFLRVSDGGSIGAVEVSTRLDYCWQFLLHSSSFEGHNQTSFLGTLAEACPDGLFRFRWAECGESDAMTERERHDSRNTPANMDKFQVLRNARKRMSAPDVPCAVSLRICLKGIRECEAGLVAVHASFVHAQVELCKFCSGVQWFDVITEVVRRVASELRFALDAGGNLGEGPD
ncbi:unnamed protein product [Polarella glacialis]|uniref:Uncharacterized protein n=1 Tax=Polarella glacialis TaxID=89957 RepID=A0A813KES6_POLGL|nr:unnamed protein product [Polarella glacialis]